MKIYTEVIYHWDDNKGELVEESSKSYDYTGPVTLCHSHYLEFPPSLGAKPSGGNEINHWVHFKAFEFRTNNERLDVALYIPPDALSTSYKSDYESASMGQVLGRTVENIRKAEGSLDQLQANMQTEAAATGNVIVDLLSQTATPANVRTAMSVAKGQVANPYIVAAYKGPTQLREQKFTFKLMPEDAKQSKICQEIVRQFKLAMLPDHAGGDNMSTPTGLFAYPHEFEIEFYINGKPLPRDSHNPLFNIGKSVLTNCDVNYTTQDTVLFFEGTQYPVTINLSLTFMEIEVMYRNKIRKGF